MKALTLQTKIENIFRLTDVQKKALLRINLKTADDLLRYLPARYVDPSSIKSVESLVAGERAVVEGRISGISAKKTWHRKVNITEAKISDNTGDLRAVWFHQPYISKLISDGDLVRLEGKLSERKGALYISNPSYEKISSPSWRGPSKLSLLPIYPATRGVSSRWIQFHVQKLFKDLYPDDFEDALPKYILDTYKLPGLFASLRAAHNPKSKKDSEGARKRLAFEEIFFIQLARMRERINLEKTSSLQIPENKNVLDEFLGLLPFSLTKTQSSILNVILKDIGMKTPMARLLEGDVGSGKTVIAAAASYLTARTGYQSTYMAPTEILAQQHFNVLSKLFATPFLKIGLLTSSEARVYPSKAFGGSPAHIPKTQMLRWTASGDIKVLVGTHALLSEKVRFHNLAFIVVDEQHRFGIAQRQKLAQSSSLKHSFVPHFLSMTATPIPRTLALTVFGDLDLSVLDEMPPGRASIATEVLIKPRERSWDIIKREIENGRQAFVICPRIEADDEKGEQKSVKKEYERISSEIFPEFKTGILHGKMTPREKEKTLQSFRDGKTNILVSTSVVEVGIDVPNATIMIVEGADRFGLAQLHQLRGRIGRGEHPSYFFAITESSSQTAAKRLRALKNAKNGFELAEYDLQLRGPGELTGKNQWGMTDLGMEALKNIKMVEAARAEARALLTEDPECNKYPVIRRTMTKLNDGGLYHFE